MVYAHVHQPDGDPHLEEVENGWVIGINSCLVSEELEVCDELINIPFFYLQVPQLFMGFLVDCIVNEGHFKVLLEGVPGRHPMG